MIATFPSSRIAISLALARSDQPAESAAITFFLVPPASRAEHFSKSIREHKGETLTHNDFHTPIARFGHGIGSLNQRFALATAGGLNDFRRDAAPDQQVSYPDGALQGKRVVVLIGADEIGMADDGDLRCGSLGDLGGYTVDCALGVGGEAVRSLHEVDQA